MAQDTLNPGLDNNAPPESPKGRTFGSILGDTAVALLDAGVQVGTAVAINEVNKATGTKGGDKVRQANNVGQAPAAAPRPPGFDASKLIMYGGIGLVVIGVLWLVRGMFK